MIKLLTGLTLLYGAHRAPELLTHVQTLLDQYRPRLPKRDGTLTERDALLITYGDQIQAPNTPPLQMLKQFSDTHLVGVVSGLHILPFYPWTSDDGFSVADYRAIDPALGSWAHIAALGENFRLMFDGVINHISTHSDWFQAFLRDEAPYRDYFITVDGNPDLSQVVRPRALPLLTPFSTPSGEKKVWTTFSADQIDLNFANSAVLLEILNVLLLYAERGATFIRLDAIAYLWKEIGTTCIHLPQTHEVIQFLRAALNDVSPHIHLVTETNVPHTDNIAYFGDGTNEAQLVYNFALPPLMLHTFRTGDARVLSEWAAGLTLPSAHTTFFNFLASHDGIGLNPVRGILSPADIDALAQQTLAHGGLISYKHNADGSQSPYELNINYFDALSNPHRAEPGAVQVDRFLAAQASMLALVGVPGLYFHSLFGSRGWREGVQQTGRNRTINRQKCDYAVLESELANPASLRAHVFTRYQQLLRVRAASPAFHPHGAQRILDLSPHVFTLERLAPNNPARALCLHNVSAQPQLVQPPFSTSTDLITNRTVNETALTLAPYQVLWLAPT